MNAPSETIIGICSICSAICGIAIGVLGHQRTVKKDSYKEGDDDGSLKSDMKYIKHRVDDVLLEQRNVNKTLSDHSERITRVEESAKQAHKRIDRIEDKDDQ